MRLHNHPPLSLLAISRIVLRVVLIFLSFTSDADKHTTRDEREKSKETKKTHRASRSDSKSAKMSLTRTGPLTFRMMDRLESSMNSTRTWVTPPREPVRPRTCWQLIGRWERMGGERGGIMSGMGIQEERWLVEW